VEKDMVDDELEVIKCVDDLMHKYNTVLDELETQLQGWRQECYNAILELVVTVRRDEQRREVSHV